MKAALRFLAIAIGAALVATALVPYCTAAALIVRAAGIQGWMGRLAQWEGRAVSERAEQIAVRNGVIRARIFRPSGTPDRAVLLVSGVHPDGIGEARLTALARDLAATGVTVVTPAIPELVHYELTAHVTDTIEDAALWMSNREDLFGSSRIAMIGVSFSGGLSIVAAGRPALRDRVAYVLSFGGHGNLPRVLRYLCTGIEPGVPGSPPRPRPPHDYALAVVLHQAVGLVVPEDQAGSLRRAIEMFLEASALSRTDQKQADAAFDAARTLQSRMPEPSATWMKLVNDRNVVDLGARLLPYLNRLGQDRSLSPDLSPLPSAPVYLLHGTDDNVIPAAETELLTGQLQGATKVRSLVSGFLTHVDVSTRPTLADTWKMLAFWTEALGER